MLSSLSPAITLRLKSAAKRLPAHSAPMFTVILPRYAKKRKTKHIMNEHQSLSSLLLPGLQLVQTCHPHYNREASYVHHRAMQCPYYVDHLPWRASQGDQKTPHDNTGSKLSSKSSNLYYFEYLHDITSLTIMDPIM